MQTVPTSHSPTRLLLLLGMAALPVTAQATELVTNFNATTRDAFSICDDSSGGWSCDTIQDSAWNGWFRGDNKGVVFQAFDANNDGAFGFVAYEQDATQCEQDASAASGWSCEPLNGASDFRRISESQVADYDGDGIEDFLYSHTDTGPAVCYGGSFPMVCEDLGVANGAYYSAVQWEDFDGDGSLDVFVAYNKPFNSGYSQLCLNDGSGGLSCSNFTASSTSAASTASDAQAFDANGDGLLDLYVEYNASYGVAGELCLNNAAAPGSFSCTEADLPQISYGGSFWGYGSTDIEAADLDADGNVDLVMGSRADAYICWSDGAGDLDCQYRDGVTTITALEGAGGAEYQVDTLDVDSDGLLDFAHASSGASESVEVCYNNGDRTFSCEAVTNEDYFFGVSFLSGGAGGPSSTLDSDDDGIVDADDACPCDTREGTDDDGDGCIDTEYVQGTRFGTPRDLFYASATEVLVWDAHTLSGYDPTTDAVSWSFSALVYDPDVTVVMGTDGRVYMVDNETSYADLNIDVRDTDGTLLHTFDMERSTHPSLSVVSGLVVDVDNDTLYVGDSAGWFESGTTGVQKFNLAGVRDAGWAAEVPSSFSTTGPVKMKACPDGTLVASSKYYSTYGLWTIDPVDGSVIAEAATPYLVQDIACDSDGNIWTVEQVSSGVGELALYDANLNELDRTSTTPSGAAFTQNDSIALDGDDRLLVHASDKYLYLSGLTSDGTGALINNGLGDSDDTCLTDPGVSDSDGDGVADDVDACPGFDDNADADGDGAADGCDVCPADLNDDSDGDGSCDSADLCAGDDATGDSDSDGVCDDADFCSGDDATGDMDLDGVCDDSDLCPADVLDDSDGDGSCDSVDLCEGDDATGDTDGDAVCDDSDVCSGDDLYGDTDADGVCDDIDACPVDNPDDTDGDAVCDSDDPCPLDIADDSDGDGVCDSDDLCPNDINDDSDGDGVCDSDDACPADLNDDSDGDGSCDSADLCVGDDAQGDADADGYCLDSDVCDDDADKLDPGVCGCGTPDADDDADGILDCLEGELGIVGDQSHVRWRPTKYRSRYDVYKNQSWATFTGQLELTGGLLAPDFREGDVGNGSILVVLGETDPLTVYDETIAYDVSDYCNSDTSDNREKWHYKQYGYNDAGVRVLANERATLRWKNSMKYYSKHDENLPEMSDEDNLGRLHSRFISADESRIRVRWNKRTLLPLSVTLNGVTLATITDGGDDDNKTYTVTSEYDTFSVLKDSGDERTRVVDVVYPGTLTEGDEITWYNTDAADLSGISDTYSHVLAEEDPATDSTSKSYWYNAGGRFHLKVPLGQSILDGDLTRESAELDPVFTVNLQVGDENTQVVQGSYTYSGYAIDGDHWRLEEVDEDDASSSASGGGSDNSGGSVGGTTCNVDGSDDDLED